MNNPEIEKSTYHVDEVVALWQNFTWWRHKKNLFLKEKQKQIVYIYLFNLCARKKLDFKILDIK